MNPFNALESEKQQSKFYKENFDLVVSLQICLYFLKYLKN